MKFWHGHVVGEGDGLVELEPSIVESRQREATLAVHVARCGELVAAVGRRVGGKWGLTATQC